MPDTPRGRFAGGLAVVALEALLLGLLAALGAGLVWLNGLAAARGLR